MLSDLYCTAGIYNSNTTLVKVKFYIILLLVVAKRNSNTTLVKVKYIQSTLHLVGTRNSNTTLVKVK